MSNFLSANIWNMHWVDSRDHCEQFRSHTVSALLHRVKPSDWSCAAPVKYMTLLFALCSGMCNENKNKTSIFEIKKKVI